LPAWPTDMGLNSRCDWVFLSERELSSRFVMSRPPQRGTKTLKPRCVLVAITFLALMSVTPAFAAPREIEEFCFEQAQRATLPYRRGAWEAFMANCIADLTPTPTKERKYRKY
jgi:hypothetical protein